LKQPSISGVARFQMIEYGYVNIKVTGFDIEKNVDIVIFDIDVNINIGGGKVPDDQPRPPATSP
jgi:hypothetical protein